MNYAHCNTSCRPTNTPNPTPIIPYKNQIKIQIVDKWELCMLIIGAHKYKGANTGLDWVTNQSLL
jgi:hypothetical protein